MANTFKGANGLFTSTYRKYAGAWVPVVVDAATGKRTTYVSCSTSGGAAETAMKYAKRAAGEGAVLVLFNDI
jgi:hypothetical protein